MPIARYDGASLWISYTNSLRQATPLDTVSGIQFFEDPFYGDEAGMWLVFKGRAAPSDYFSVPDAEEIGDPEDFFECYAAE